jgi:uncharacterized C2H2 Zn-finger protein
MPAHRIKPVEPEKPISHPHFHQTYKYDTKLKKWEFMGFRCIRCGAVYKKENTIDKHSETCKFILTTISMENKERINQPNIITTTGEAWTPVETNQKFSYPK